MKGMFYSILDFYIEMLSKTVMYGMWSSNRNQEFTERVKITLCGCWGMLEFVDKCSGTRGLWREIFASHVSTWHKYAWDKPLYLIGNSCWRSVMKKKKKQKSHNDGPHHDHTACRETLLNSPNILFISWAS